MVHVSFVVAVAVAMAVVVGGFAGCVEAASPPAALDRITASSTDKFLYDSHGRVRLFHGVNGVHKAAPWWPDWLLNETLVAEMASWGVNVVRVGWLFNGLMPQPNFVNESYYKDSLRVVEMLASHGIHALLDAHQDVLSSKFCLYDTWPLWVINKSVPKKPFPWPLTGNCSSRAWGANEITDAAATCYQDIFSNTAGMRDDYAEFWSQSAMRWSNNTNVIGYELMNEPFAGNVYEDPLLFLPGVAGQKNLQPFYHVLAESIRAHDKETLIFYEPVVWGMIFNSTVLGSGFTQVPGGAMYANRSVFSYHAYCASFGGNRALCDDLVMPEIFDAVDKDVATVGGSSFLTEWGGCDTSNVAKCEAMVTLADAHLQSWTEYGGFGQGGPLPDAAALRVITRTYTRAFAGKPLSMSFNATTLAFKSCWTMDTSIKAPSIVFVPFERLYGGVTGAVVGTTANLEAHQQLAQSEVWFTPTKGATNGDTACVTVTKATDAVI